MKNITQTKFNFKKIVIAKLNNPETDRMIAHEKLNMQDNFNGGIIPGFNVTTDVETSSASSFGCIA
jgi:hypothetical protein